LSLAYVLAIPPVDEAQPEGGHTVARPDASSSSIKPLTTSKNLGKKPQLSFEADASRETIKSTLYGNFLCNDIVRIELIAKEGDSLADRRQLRVFGHNNCLLFTVYATKLLLKDNPAANSQKDPSLLQIFESLLLSTAQQITKDILSKLQEDIVKYQNLRSETGLSNNKYVAILHRRRLPQGWGPWQRSVQPLV
jgi:hypothetical protein